jgi:hypothetical protein
MFRRSVFCSNYNYGTFLGVFVTVWIFLNFIFDYCVPTVLLVSVENMLFVISNGYFLIRILSWFFYGESKDSDVISLNLGELWATSSSYLGPLRSSLFGVLRWSVSYTLLLGLWTDLEYLLSNYAFLM